MFHSSSLSQIISQLDYAENEEEFQDAVWELKKYLKETGVINCKRLLNQNEHKTATA